MVQLRCQYLGHQLTVLLPQGKHFCCIEDARFAVNDGKHFVSVAE